MVWYKVLDTEFQLRVIDSANCFCIGTNLCAVVHHDEDPMFFYIKFYRNLVKLTKFQFTYLPITVV